MDGKKITDVIYQPCTFCVDRSLISMSLMREDEICACRNGAKHVFFWMVSIEVSHDWALVVHEASLHQQQESRLITAVVTSRQV